MSLHHEGKLPNALRHPRKWPKPNIIARHPDKQASAKTASGGGPFSSSAQPSTRIGFARDNFCAYRRGNIYELSLGEVGEKKTPCFLWMTANVNTSSQGDNKKKKKKYHKRTVNTLTQRKGWSY
jgi:hypothetical protein